MTRQPTLAELQLFVAVAQAGSYRRALDESAAAIRLAAGGGGLFYCLEQRVEADFTLAHWKSCWLNGPS